MHFSAGPNVPVFNGKVGPLPMSWLGSESTAGASQRSRVGVPESVPSHPTPSPTAVLPEANFTGHRLQSHWVFVKMQIPGQGARGVMEGENMQIHRLAGTGTSESLCLPKFVR